MQNHLKQHDREESRTANMGLWQVGLTEVIEHQ